MVKFDTITVACYCLSTYIAILMDFLSKKLISNIVLKACLESGLTSKVGQSVVEKVLAELSPKKVDKEKIIKLFKEGKSKAKIATLCSCSRTYVYKVLKEAKLVE